MAEDGSSGDDTATDSGTEEERPEVRNPFADATDRHGTAGPRDSPVDDDAPFASLATETRERRERRKRREQAGPGSDDPFQEMDVSAVESDDLWESLADADAEPAVGPGGEAEQVGESDDRPEHVVNKREYCQRCPYLSDPPDVACEHDGTDIVEVVDADRFRVRGCPMVGEEGTPSVENR